MGQQHLKVSVNFVTKKSPKKGANSTVCPGAPRGSSIYIVFSFDRHMRFFKDILSLSGRGEVRFCQSSQFCRGM